MILSLLHTVKMLSDNVGLTFGLEKCARLSVLRGKVVRTGDLTLYDDFNIR